MDREAIDTFLERSILALVLAILIFAPLAIGAVDPPEFVVVQFLTMGVALLWLLRLWLGDKTKLLWPPICWPVLAFVLYAIARYLTADIEYVARQELLQVLVCAVLFFATVCNLYRQEYAQIISFAVIVLAMGISCFALYQFATHHWDVWGNLGQYPGRATGTYISPNHFAGFLEMIFPLALAYIMVGRVKPLTRILLGYCALVILAAIVVTFSRGGWGATGVAVFALLGILLFDKHHQFPAFIVLLVLIGGGAIVGTKYLPQTASYIQRSHTVGMKLENVDLQTRADVWRAAIAMWHDHFWLGVGPAHYNYRYPQYRSETVQRTADRAHNDYLNLLADWGTVGGIIVLGGMAAFVIGLLQTRKHVRRVDNTFGSGFSNRHAFFLGGGCGLLALAVHSIGDFNLHIPANAILAITLLALLSSNLRFATESFWAGFRLPLKIVASALLAAGILYLALTGVRCVREQLWLARADNTPYFSSQRADALQHAFVIEPQNFATSYAIGECYRSQSFEGGNNYESLANTAMTWYLRGMKLNPFDAYNYFRYGMCLDWLGKHAEAESYFWEAEARDPNNYFVLANFGWHYFQAGDYAAARPLLIRSIRLQRLGNPIAASYLELTEHELTDEAAGTKRFPNF